MVPLFEVTKVLKVPVNGSSSVCPICSDREAVKRRPNHNQTVSAAKHLEQQLNVTDLHLLRTLLAKGTLQKKLENINDLAS